MEIRFLILKNKEPGPKELTEKWVPKKDTPKKAIKTNREISIILRLLHGLLKAQIQTPVWDLVFRFRTSG